MRSKNKVIVFLLCVGFAINTVHTEVVVDTSLKDQQVLIWLSQHSAECPKEVTVTNNTKASIFGPNQELKGTIKISSGTKVRVIKYSPDTLCIKMGEMDMKIPTLTTDLVLIANTIYKALNSRESTSENESTTTNETHKRPVISPTASVGYFCEAYKI